MEHKMLNSSSIDSDFSVDDWFLMQSVLYPLSILVCYWYFVLNYGPKLMANKPAYQLNLILPLYNACQVIFSIWLAVKYFSLKNKLQSVRDCKVPSESLNEFTSYMWWYFFAKITELLDTVFFVLRKKRTQITGLHLYHHSLMVILTWMYTKYYPDGQGVFPSLINVVVHIIMYTYYFLASLGEKYQKYIWWKKYVTTIQLIQFGIATVFLLYLVIKRCYIPETLMALYVFNDVVFIYLFTDFYLKTYRRNKFPEEKRKINSFSSSVVN